ncbi:protein hupE, partial [Stutzerimonas stutzeri]
HALGYGLVRGLPQAAAPLVRIAGAVSAVTGAWLLVA